MINILHQHSSWTLCQSTWFTISSPSVNISQSPTFIISGGGELLGVPYDWHVSNLSCASSFLDLGVPYYWWWSLMARPHSSDLTARGHEPQLHATALRPLAPGGAAATRAAHHRSHHARHTQQRRQVDVWGQLVWETWSAQLFELRLMVNSAVSHGFNWLNLTIQSQTQAFIML